MTGSKRNNKHEKQELGRKCNSAAFRSHMILQQSQLRLTHRLAHIALYRRPCHPPPPPRLAEPRALASLDCHPPPPPPKAEDSAFLCSCPYPLEEVPWVCCQPLPVFL